MAADSLEVQPLNMSASARMEAQQPKWLNELNGKNCEGRLAKDTGRIGKRGRGEVIESIRGELIVIFARDLGCGIGKRRWVEARIIVKLDVLCMTVHKADVVNSVIVRDILSSKKILVPGIAPMNCPLGHHDGAGGMFHVAE